MLLSWCGTSHTIGEYVDALNLMHIFFFSHSFVTAASLSKCFIAFLFFYPPSSAWCTFSMQRLYKLLKDGSPKWCVFVLTINLLKKKVPNPPPPFYFFNFPLFFKFDVETNWVVCLDNKITLMFIFDSTCALFSILILPWISCHGKACKTGIIHLLDTATGITRSWQECGTYLILKSLKM